MSSKIALLLTSLALLSFSLVDNNSYAADQKIVNVYSWQDYYSPTLIKQFEKETGIKVNYDVFSDDETMEAKLLAGGSGYDIVAPANAFLARELKIGLYQPLDKSKLSNWKNLDPAILKLLDTFDPGNKYGMAYIFGVDGLGYNEAEVKKRIGNAPLDSWDLIFKPEYAKKLADCGIALLNSPNDVYQIALMYLKKDPNSHDKKDLDAAQALLKNIRPYIKKFDSDNFAPSLLNGEYCVAMVYPGAMAKFLTENQQLASARDIKSVIPREGTLLWTDNLAIPADAPHPENAYIFLNYFLQADIAGKHANEVKYGEANLAGRQYVDAAFRNNTALYPAQTDLNHVFMTTEVPTDYQRLLTRSWTDLKQNQ